MSIVFRTRGENPDAGVIMTDRDAAHIIRELRLGEPHSRHGEASAAAVLVGLRHRYLGLSFNEPHDPDDPDLNQTAALATVCKRAMANDDPVIWEVVADAIDRSAVEQIADGLADALREDRDRQAAAERAIELLYDALGVGPHHADSGHFYRDATSWERCPGCWGCDVTLRRQPR